MQLMTGPTGWSHSCASALAYIKQIVERHAGSKKMSLGVSSSLR